MKRLFVVLCILSFISVSVEAQNKNDSDQSFTIQNFEVSDAHSQPAYTLAISFELVLSKEVKDAYENPYYFHCIVLDKDKKELWRNPDEDRFYAYRFDPEDALINYMSYQIPLEDLALPEGKHIVSLQFSVSNKNKEYPVFFQKQLQVDVPKFYDYSEQYFSFSNYRVSLDNHTFKTPGILVKFNTTALFTQEQIKGLYKDSFMGEYALRVQINNLENTERVSYFSTKTGQDSFVVRLLKNTHQLFIPNNELKLAKGTYDLEIQALAYTQDPEKEIGHTDKKIIHIQQPELYKLHFVLNECSIVEKAYDVGSVVGRIFSISHSNTGKGNPDVYWELRTGNYTKYTSEVIENNFWAAREQATIYITDDDSLQLVLWDKDVFSKDDWIADFLLKNATVGVEESLQNTQPETIEHIIATYHKEKLTF